MEPSHANYHMFTATWHRLKAHTGSRTRTESLLDLEPKETCKQDPRQTNWRPPAKKTPTNVSFNDVPFGACGCVQTCPSTLLKCLHATLSGFEATCSSHHHNANYHHCVNLTRPYRRDDTETGWIQRKLRQTLVPWRAKASSPYRAFLGAT